MIVKLGQAFFFFFLLQQVSLLINSRIFGIGLISFLALLITTSEKISDLFMACTLLVKIVIY